MNILCVICSDLLTQPDDIFYTACGHVFHFDCLTQWIDRSKSCPQCREKVTQSRIHKLYLTVSNSEMNAENDPQKDDKVMNLKFQIKLKEKDINYFMSKNATLEKQNSGLRKEVRKLENDICEKISAIHSLKEQIKYFKEQLLGYESAKKEVTQLKKKIEELRNLKMLLDAPIEDVKDIVGRDKSPTTLLTYVYVMKKEIVSNLSKIKHLKIKLKDLQSENAKMIMRPDVLSQNYSSNRQLEEQFAFCESEKMALQSRVIELEKMLGIAESPKKTVVDIPQVVKSIHETPKECLDNSVVQESGSRKRSHINAKYKKHSMEKEDTSCSSMDITKNDNCEVDSMIKSTNSDSSIALKKSKLSSIYEKINDTNNMHEKDNTNSIVRRGKHGNTSANMYSRTPEEKLEKVGKEKLNKTKHKRDIIDLT